MRWQFWQVFFVYMYMITNVINPLVLRCSVMPFKKDQIISFYMHRVCIKSGCLLPKAKKVQVTPDGACPAAIGAKM